MKDILENDDLFNLAFNQHISGDLFAAEISYRKILATQPDHIEARHYLGVLLHQVGKSEEGIELILSVIEAHPQHSERFNDLGNILSSLGRLEDAATAFQLSLQLDSGSANVWNNLGFVLKQLNFFADAETAFRNAVKCDPSFAPALNNIANLLAETGNEEESSYFACQAFIQPPHDGKPLHHLGVAYYRLGMLPEAAACYRQWLEIEPENPIALHHLLACEGSHMPDKAANAYVIQHFDNLADQFEQKLVDSLLYRGPQIIDGLLQQHFPNRLFTKALDAGCGTGLCAEILKHHAQWLVGIDLSPKMLAKAIEKGHYDELHESDLQEYLFANHGFDLIVMADTLIYFGNLSSLFSIVRDALSTNGAFVFTVEKAEVKSVVNKQFRLNPSGRFQHTLEYLCQAIGEAGFKLLGIEEIFLRNEFHHPLKGLAIVVSKLLPARAETSSCCC